MNVLLSLTLAGLVALLFSGAIRRMPPVSYGAAALVVVAYLLLSEPTTNLLVRPLQDLIQKGQLGFAFLTVVMFIGVLGEDSVLGRRLIPIRGELSIVGGILLCGHFIPLLVNYSGLLGHFTRLRPNLMIPLALSMVLLVLLIMLVTTSFRRVKAAMSSRLWRRVQSFAYVFFGLIYLHILGYLLVPALQGGITARVSVISYSIVLAAYVVLRVRKGALAPSARGGQTSGTAKAAAERR
jgi:DMSO/TMAO reductase YedYZ heme-binding membrane subunit